MNFQEEILQLIESKKEGPYWDFKEIPHTENKDLLHDILCMSNSLFKHDKYIIMGVSDPAKGCIIKGVSGNRKTQNQYIDFISSKRFAADNRPELELKKLVIEGCEIEVLVIIDRPYKPYYITRNYQKVRANYIYTRVGDTNTHIDESADYYLIEKMWRQRFGLDISPSEKYKIILEDKDGWNLDGMKNKKPIYYHDSPEYQIEFSDPCEGYEVYSYYFINSKSFFGTARFKYLSTILFELPYAYVDEMRIPIAVPDAEYIRVGNKFYYYYYYGEDTLNFKFLKLLGLQVLLNSMEKESLPFIFFKNSDERKRFNQHVESVKNVKTSISRYKDERNIKDKMKKDGKELMVDANALSFLIKEYYRWDKS